jgi:hypothetical protein
MKTETPVWLLYAPTRALFGCQLQFLRLLWGRGTGTELTVIYNLERDSRSSKCDCMKTLSPRCSGPRAPVRKRMFTLRFGLRRRLSVCRRAGVSRPSAEGLAVPVWEDAGLFRVGIYFIYVLVDDPSLNSTGSLSPSPIPHQQSPPGKRARRRTALRWEFFPSCVFDNSRQRFTPPPRPVAHGPA